MWYLVHVETGVALSSEMNYSFFVTCCVFADDSQSESECAACIYACINVSVYVNQFLFETTTILTTFSRPRAFFLKTSILRLIESIQQRWTPFLHNEKLLKSTYILLFYCYHQKMYYVTQNAKLLVYTNTKYNNFTAKSLKIVHQNLYIKKEN